MSKNVCLIDWSIFILQGPRVYIYTLLKELRPDTIRIRIPNYTESVYKTMQTTKEIIKLSFVTNRNSSRWQLAASGLLLRVIGNPLAIVIGRPFYLVIGTILLPEDLVTFTLALIGNHPYQQPASYCHPILPSWTRAQKWCQHKPSSYYYYYARGIFLGFCFDDYF